jgi:hypothetical protein
MNTVFRTCIVVSALSLCDAARAEKAVLECTADTWVARDDPTPHGHDRDLRLPRRGGVLLDFRTAAIEGWRITKATLLLHLRQDAAPRRVSIAAMPATWSESQAIWKMLPHLRGRVHEVRHYGEGWVSIELAPQEVNGHGIYLTTAGEAWLRFDARESVSYAPYLLIEGSR